MIIQIRLHDVKRNRRSNPAHGYRPKIFHVSRFAGFTCTISPKKTLFLLGLIAAIAISAFAAGNAFGRISWGWGVDKLGSKTIPVSLAFLAAMIVLSWLFIHTSTGAIVSSALLGVGFGACFVVYATPKVCIWQWWRGGMWIRTSVLLLVFMWRKSPDRRLPPRVWAV